MKCSISASMKRGCLPFVIIGFVLWFAQTTLAAIDITGFGGVALNTTTKVTAGAAISVLTIAEAEIGGVFADTITTNVNINLSLPFFFLDWAYTGEEVGVWPYLMTGIGTYEGDSAFNLGFGARIPLRTLEMVFSHPSAIRVDYRHFFIRDAENVDRLYIGVDFLFWGQH